MVFVCNKHYKTVQNQKIKIFIMAPNIDSEMKEERNKELRQAVEEERRARVEEARRQMAEQSFYRLRARETASERQVNMQLARLNQQNRDRR